MNKKTMRLCIGVLVTGVGVLAYQLYPTQERERHNVVDSRVDGKAAGRKDHAQTAEDAAKSTQVSGDGNAAGLPMRMVNAPSFNQIVAAAALVNGAVDQKETAAFVELTTQKRIADLKVELASTEAELAKAQMQRAEYERKGGTSANTSSSNSGTPEEFVLPDEAPLDGAVSNQAFLVNENAPQSQQADTKKNGNESASDNSAIKFSKSMKLKGILGDGRYSLQLGRDFAANVKVGQVVFSRYRVEGFESLTGCLTYTDLRLKNSRGFACYN